MHLSDFDLKQLNERQFKRLSTTQKDALMMKLLSDLQEARERLNANSRNSSRPPSSDAPWQASADEGSDPEEP